MGVDVELWRARIGLFNGGRGGRSRHASLTNQMLHCDVINIVVAMVLLTQYCSLSLFLAEDATSNCEKSVIKSLLNTRHDPIRNRAPSCNCCYEDMVPERKEEFTPHHSSNTCFSRTITVILIGVIVVYSFSLLLLLAGDVELNPGPGMDTVVSISDLFEVCEKVRSASPKWFDLGLALNLSYTDLANFRDTYRGDNDVCLREALARRLQSGGPLTWRGMCTALRNSTVARNDVAEAIEEYVEKKNREELKITQSTQENDSSDSTTSQLLCKKFNTSLSIEKLEVDSMKMEMKFGDLVSQLNQSHEITKDSLVTCLVGINCLKKVFDKGNPCVFGGQREKLSKCSNTAEVWQIIADYFSFFDYYMVELITNRLGTDIDKENMRQYKTDFIEYAKRRVVKGEIRSNSREDTVTMIVKLDSTYDNCEMSRLKLFESNLSSILNLNDGVLKLVKIDDGCIELIFSLPYFITSDIFPLSTDQERALQSQGVLQLHCRDVHYPAESQPDEGDNTSDNDSMQGVASFPAASVQGIDTAGLSVTRAVSSNREGKPHMKSRPLLKDLVKELDSVLTWQLLMINLGVKKYENDKIEINFPCDIDRQKQEAFDKWLRMKPDACWKNVIDALYEIEEITLASSLARKYAWEDPRVYVSSNYLSTSKAARITARKIGDISCRRFLPKLAHGLDYYTLEDALVRPINRRSAAIRTTYFSGLLLRPQSRFDCYSLVDFFRSIEENISKSDFRVGLEARFGQLYLKLNPENVLPANSTSQEWMRSKSLRKAAFNTQVEEADVGKLFVGREQLGKEVTKISVKFEVEGQHEGRYSAVIDTNGDGDMFYLDAVYREPAIAKRARLSIALPGYKYDLRISDCTECILLAEHENSIPYQMAETITRSLCRLPARKLRIILHGLSRNKQSIWKVNYIRQRIQKQYKWKPEKKWILAQYDVDVFDYKTNRTVEVHPLNEGVDITEVDYSRKEVKLWGQKIFPSNVSDTHPSRDKYYYMEGIEGVRLPGGKLREPYNWTTEELLRDFEEFLGDAFKIAHILDGSPY